MLSELLPHQVDIRKLVTRRAHIGAQISLTELNRITESLVDKSGDVVVDLDFGVDDQGIKIITGSLEALVKVNCQRCLQAMSVSVCCDVSLGIVWDEAQAASLPKSLDPFIVGEEPVDLRDIVEDELLLSLPFVSYHEPQQCTGFQSYSSSEEDEPQQQEANPFSVLKDLKFKE